MSQMIINMASGTLWELNGDIGPEHLGFVPSWFHARDEKSAREQADAGYERTGGCALNNLDGADVVVGADGKYAMRYSDDPPMRELARCELRDEIIVLFEGEWISIFAKHEAGEKPQPQVVARVD